MENIENILISNIKPKEKRKRIVNIVIDGTVRVEDFMSYFIITSDVNKGTCADALKHIAMDRPDILFPYIDLIIEYIDYNAPRVKWGIQETIGNLAERYPEEVAKAIPKLLKNAEKNHKNTTVVRWCAAYGLVEILVNNKEIQKDLLPKIQEIIESENNKGVKNVYLTALKRIERTM